ncbi:SCO family protein [Shewanella sp. SR44-3]|uniref:SCO family protein n=1 Tax=Shewanella sp. SR44-3 TaxID=2760936 RepID=UPI0015F99371|nr:SCO family protein [Shewanella sp. SR44-3]MBB1270696.1 SCO family protein [Shewanella sp. SR44-3]
MKQTLKKVMNMLAVVQLYIVLALFGSSLALAQMPILKGIGGEFSLKSSKGGEVSLSDFKDKVVMLFFGYTNCADICPTTMAHISQMMNKLTPEQRAKVQVLFISIDSDYDTPKHLNKYLAYFDPSFIGLVDEREKIDHVAKLFHADYIKLANDKVTTEYKKLSLDDAQQEQKGYLYSHSAKIFVMDTQNRVRGFFYAGTSIEEMKQQVISLL